MEVDVVVDEVGYRMDEVFGINDVKGEKLLLINGFVHCIRDVLVNDWYKRF